MSASNKTWSWTVVQTPSCHRDLPDFYDLRCSPQGQLLMHKNLVGKLFSIWAEDAPGEGMSAEPTPQELQQAHLLTQVQLDPNHVQNAPYISAMQSQKKHYTAAYTLPSGEPQVPPTLAATHGPFQESNGSWWFLPKIDPRLTQARPPSSTANDQQAHKLTLAVPAEAPVPRSQPKEPVLKPEPKDPLALVKQAEIVKQSEVEKEAKAVKETKAAHEPEARKEPAETKQKPKAMQKPKQAKAPNPDHPITGPVPPWRGSPDDPIILDYLESAIHDYLVCSDHQGIVLALWILHTYTCRASYLTPYLNIWSPIEESGKSTCMIILRSLCAQPWWAAGVSRSVFKRQLMTGNSTVLLDNWHTVFRGTDKQQLTGLLLNGCDMARDFGALQPDAQGEYSPVNFETFCPKAFAGLESLPPSLARRSIPIVLQRRKPHERVKSAIHLLTPYNTQKLTSWMQSWAQDQTHINQISNTFEEYGSEKHALPGFTPHQQDSSRVLIALADVIGGHWPQKARAALQEIFREQHEREATPLHLLSDIRDAFARHGNPERIFTAEVLDHLLSLDHRTWHEWSKNGDPMTAHALSRLLRKSFNIYSRSQRRGEKKLRGYQQSDFLEAWERYLPHPNPSSTQENQGLSQCPASNTEATADTAITAAAANVDNRSPDLSRLGVDEEPALRMRRSDKKASEGSKDRISASKTNPCLNVPLKSRLPKSLTKSTSLLKNLADRAVEIFTATRL